MSHAVSDVSEEGESFRRNCQSNQQLSLHFISEQKNSKLLYQQEDMTNILSYLFVRFVTFGIKFVNKFYFSGTDHQISGIITSHKPTD